MYFGGLSLKLTCWRVQVYDISRLAPRVGIVVKHQPPILTVLTALCKVGTEWAVLIDEAWASHNLVLALDSDICAH